MPPVNRKGLKKATLAAILKIDFPKRDHLLAPWLRTGESVLLWAPSGVGKTLLAWSIALAIAGGGKVLGWQAPKARRVMIVDGEMAIDDLKARAQMLAPAIDGFQLGEAAQNIHVLSRQWQDHTATFPDIGKEVGQRVIMKEAEEFGADVVVLDNFSTLVWIEDENSAAAMNPVLDFLLKLKQARRACILVHHANKAGSSARGSSKLEATFEIILGLEKKKDALIDPAMGATFGLRWTKYRGMRDDSICDREVWLSTDASGMSQWHAEFSKDEQAEALVLLVQTCKFPTQAALGAAYPRHLRPEPDKVPSAGWISELKNTAIVVRGLITKDRWDACIREARRLAGGGDVEESPEWAAEGEPDGRDLVDSLEEEAGGAHDGSGMSED